MKVSVSFLPPESSDMDGRVCLVVDVIRAATVMCIMFERGCDVVHLSPTPAAALEVQQLLPGGTLLCGENPDGAAPLGFDLEPSPSQLLEVDFRGRDAVLTTANGVPAVLSARDAGAGMIMFAALRNVGAAAARAIGAASLSGTDIAIVCSGRSGNRHIALEDVYCAGLLVRRMVAFASGAGQEVALDDSAHVAAAVSRTYRDARSVMDESMTGQHFAERGQQEDLRHCAATDVTQLVPWVALKAESHASPLPVVLSTEPLLESTAVGPASEPERNA